MADQSRTEKRKEQNRRAQANHRKKRQQRLRYLEEKLGHLASTTDGGDGQDDNANAPGREGVFAQGSGDLATPLGNFGSMPIDDIDQHQYLRFPGAEQGALSSDFGVDTTELHNDLSVWEPTGWLDTFDHLNPVPNSEVQVSDPATMQPDRPSRYIFDALAENAKVLRIPNAALISATSGSTFFSPLSALDTSSVPDALRPTMAQLTYQHHPYIDCIPLPELRDRFILALNRQPPVVPDLELWHDVLLGGMIPGPDADNGVQWRLEERFSTKWKDLLTYDMGTLLAQTFSTNPPLRVVFPSQTR